MLHAFLTVPMREFSCNSPLPFPVSVLVTFHLACLHIIFSSVCVAVWPSFGK